MRGGLGWAGLGWLTAIETASKAKAIEHRAQSTGPHRSRPAYAYVYAYVLHSRDVHPIHKKPKPYEILAHPPPHPM